MSESETPISRLPMALEPSRQRPSLKRSDIAAAFVSQLLAERNNMAPQRARRRGTAEGAISAYSSCAKVAVKRMPLGYRTSLTV